MNENIRIKLLVIISAFILLRYQNLSILILSFFYDVSSGVSSGKYETQSLKKKQIKSKANFMKNFGSEQISVSADLDFPNFLNCH